MYRRSTYVEYFQARGLRPGDYLISNSEKHGVLDAKRSLQNWMSYNREKFMVKDRDKIVEEGKKKRHATISWHGLHREHADRPPHRTLHRGRNRRQGQTENKILLPHADAGALRQRRTAEAPRKAGADEKGDAFVILQGIHRLRLCGCPW